MMTLKDLKEFDTDTVLGALGVRRTGSVDWLGAAAGGLAIGLLVGTALGLLFAPQSGQKLRDSVRRRIDDGSSEGAPASGNARGQLESTRQPEA